jgi:Ni/Co efflux regulator RcnB
MKKLTTVAAAIALAFASLGAAAQPGHDDHGRGRGDDRHGHDDHRDHGGRDYGHRDYGHHDYRRGPPPRYYGHRGHWERGHRYDGPVYVVRDYGNYRLRPPPRGYHWVRNNSDYLLVAVATGVILDIATR